MKVEIWSDVICPWCYIGKRRFEMALAQFIQKDKIEIEWKSYQLDPSLITDPNKSINQMLAEKKGWTIDYAKEMNDHVSQLAKEVGLDYNFDKAIVANTFDAHRLIQLSKKKNQGNKAEEFLFKAYFTDGKNIGDHNTLIQLGKEIGLDPTEVSAMLESDAYAKEVKADVYEAYQMGSRSVPFYLMNNKFAITGAQSPEIFLNALKNALEEMEHQN
jgi:predicted DsbA family dithiol-disulfide isomerase